MRWLPVPGYEGRYDVSDTGQVRSLISTRNLPVPRPHKANPNSSGYLALRLSDGQTTRTRLVHHLVLLAFVGPRPEGTEARHRNGRQTDNSVANLSWESHSVNMQDRVEHGTHRSRNTGKTVCDNGHAYTPENTYTGPNGWRQCRTCRNRAKRDHYRRSKA